MEINDIRTQGVEIRELSIPPVVNIFDTSSKALALPVSPPVVVDIGVPIVDIPGCVEAHEANNGSKTLPEDDKQGLITFCDGGYPSFNPLDYNPNEMVLTGPPEVDGGVKIDPEIPETPATSTPKQEIPTVDCPTPAQEAKEPVGTFLNGYREKVTGYELIGNQCIQITEKVPLPTQIVAGLPSGGQVVQVGGIAAVATTSALLAKPLADILLKAVKPAVKKVLKKVAAIRGKKPPVLSSGERRAEQRQMNHAVKALRSVFPKRKKKQKE